MESNTIDFARVVDETGVTHVHYLPETASTNSVAMPRAAQLDSGACELVITSRQTQGRGRGANRWHSSDGALAFSLITRRVAISPGQTPMVSLAVGVGVCHAVESLVPRASTRLKWPNDIYLNGKKSAGILIEIPADAAGRFVVGIGMNVNNSLGDAPPEVQSMATSLRVAAGRALDPTDVLIAALRQIDACLTMLESDDPHLAQAWRDCSLLIGRRVRVTMPGRTLEGLCQTIADDGALVLETREGEIPCYGGSIDWFDGGPLSGSKIDPRSLS